jgi:sulfite reductase (NADPH) hemoprotein beta-component
MTGNQNLIIAKVSESNKPTIDALLDKHGLKGGDGLTGLRLGSMACVALPTCGQAMAEAERQLPGLLDRLEEIVRELGLSRESIVMRMSCSARP